MSGYKPKSSPLQCTLAAMFVGLLISGNVQAETSGFFVGLGMGSSHIDEDEPISVFFVPGQNLNDRVDFRSFYLGYKTSEVFSLELGHSSLDTAHKFYELRTDIFTALAPLQFEHVKIKRTYLSAVVSSPYWHNIAVLGLVGYSVFDVKRTWSTLGRPVFVESSSADGIYIGAGLIYRFNERFKTRIQWTKSDAADFEIEISRLSLEYSF